MEAVISKFVELLKSSPRIYAALTLAGMCVVFPFHWQHNFGLDQLRGHYLPWATLGTIVFAFLFIMSVYDAISKAIRTRIERKLQIDEAEEHARQTRNNMEVSIRALSPSERLTLTCFVALGQQTLELSTLDDSVNRLLQRGMIRKFQGFSGTAFRAFHEIDQSLFDFLDQNRRLIGPEWRELERREKTREPWY